MLVAFDEGPGPPIRYQYAELGKLYSVVSQLVRCCDVSSRMRSSITVRKLTNRHQFFCVCPLIDGNLRRNIVKVVVETRAAGVWFCNKLCQCCDAILHQQQDRLIKKLLSICFLL